MMIDTTFKEVVGRSQDMTKLKGVGSISEVISITIHGDHDTLSSVKEYLDRPKLASQGVCYDHGDLQCH